MSDQKLLTFKDDAGFQDALEFFMKDQRRSSGPAIGGVAIFKDPAGNVLLRAKNLVVARGRIFSLENLFKLDINPTVEDIKDFRQDRSRSVCLFSIGSGGTLPDDPWNPLIVNPWETAINTPIPFRSYTPSLGDSLPVELENIYYGKEEIEVGPDSAPAIQYFLKRMNINTNFVPEWHVDKKTNVCAVKNVLNIDKNDARGSKISEIAFFLASPKAGVNNFEGFEMFSRITFDTESLHDNKSLTVEYYTFC